jgi:hypothetical protein
MKPNQHECPAPGCGRTIPTSLFACRTDWYRLPKATRDKINSAYYQGDGSYLDAVMEAEAWYEANPKPGVAKPTLTVAPDPQLPLGLPGE